MRKQLWRSVRPSQYAACASIRGKGGGGQLDSRMHKGLGLVVFHNTAFHVEVAMALDTIAEN